MRNKQLYLLMYQKQFEEPYAKQKVFKEYPKLDHYLGPGPQPEENVGIQNFQDQLTPCQYGNEIKSWEKWSGKTGSSMVS